MPSPLVKRMSGMYIADSIKPLPSVSAWAQEECRNGSLRILIERFAMSQPESIDPSLALIEKVDADGILLRIPCKTMDHESTHPFASEVWMKINPLVREVVRVLELP